ncbi:MAG: fibronectin type III-like domain-contianing protein [Bacteroidota bacterium]
MYVQDKFGSVTRPVRELKGFKRVELEPGQETVVKFTLRVSDLAFYTADMTFKAEPGDFVVYVGSDSNTQLQAGFSLKP